MTAPVSASVEAPVATDPAAAEAAAPTVQPPDEAARLVEVLTAENAQLRSRLTAAADQLGTALGRGDQWKERAGRGWPAHVGMTLLCSRVCSFTLEGLWIVQTAYRDVFVDDLRVLVHARRVFLWCYVCFRRPR